METVKDAPAGERMPKAAFEVAAKGAVLVDAESGEVLFEQDAHKELPLASVTKVMTMLLVMEAVDSGKITLDDCHDLGAGGLDGRQPDVYGSG